MPPWLLEGIYYVETFRVAVGRVGDSSGPQERASSLGTWQAWVSNQGGGEGHRGPGWQEQIGAALVSALSGCLLSKVQAENLLLPEAPASPCRWLFCGMFKELQEGQLVRETDAGLALLIRQEVVTWQQSVWGQGTGKCPVAVVTAQHTQWPGWFSQGRAGGTGVVRPGAGCVISGLRPCRRLSAFPIHHCASLLLVPGLNLACSLPALHFTMDLPLVPAFWTQADLGFNKTPSAVCRVPWLMLPSCSRHAPALLWELSPFPLSRIAEPWAGAPTSLGWKGCWQPSSRPFPPWVSPSSEVPPGSHVAPARCGHFK